jgi:hypothetical protein
MTMISRNPRQIVAYDVDKSVNSKAVQTIVDSVSAFEKNYTDGGGVYLTAYNKFGEWKQNYRERHPKCGRDFSFSHVNFT